jgi:hypothetical protein
MNFTELNELENTILQQVDVQKTPEQPPNQLLLMHYREIWMIRDEALHSSLAKIKILFKMEYEKVSMINQIGNILFLDKTLIVLKLL